METPGIVNGFDVAEHAPSGIFQVAERFVVGPFVLERPEKAFHDGVVVAASGAAHRALQAEGLQDVLVVVAAVLAAAIAVVQQVSSGRASCLHGLTKGRADEFCGQRVAQRPADHFATEQIEHVRSRSSGRIGPGRGRCGVLRSSDFQPHFSHRPRHRVTARRLQLGLFFQGDRDLPTVVDAIRLPINLRDRLPNPRPSPSARTLGRSTQA